MARLTTTVSKELDFNGETYIVRLRRLKRADVLKLMPLMPEPDEAGNYKFDPQRNPELIDRLGDIMPKYLVGVKTNDVIEDDDGTTRAVEPSDIVDESYFMPLFFQVVGLLMECSFASGEEVKKPEEPHNGIATGTVT